MPTEEVTSRKKNKRRQAAAKKASLKHLPDDPPSFASGVPSLERDFRQGHRIKLNETCQSSQNDWSFSRREIRAEVNMVASLLRRDLLLMGEIEPNSSPKK